MEAQYLTYEMMDFAQDDRFISWAKHKDENQDAFWQEFIESHPEKRKTIEEAKDFVQSLKFTKEAVKEVEVDRIWSEIMDETSTKQAKTRTLTWVAVAASIALLISLPFWWNASEMTVTADVGEQTLHLLPDESNVTLNAGSSLTYDEGDWDKNRNVKLKGEAFFSVQKGSTFSVQTDGGIVSVLGTSFNVRTWDDILEVQCYTGRVSVTSGQEEVILTQGESVVHKNGVKAPLTKEKFNTEKSTWRSGIAFFDDTELESVFLEMERQFPYEIEATNQILTKPYSGFFTTNLIDSALYQVCWPLGLNYEISGNKVRITE